MLPSGGNLDIQASASEPPGHMCLIGSQHDVARGQASAAQYGGLGTRRQRLGSGARLCATGTSSPTQAAWWRRSSNRWQRGRGEQGCYRGPRVGAGIGEPYPQSSRITAVEHLLGCKGSTLIPLGSGRRRPVRTASSLQPIVTALPAHSDPVLSLPSFSLGAVDGAVAGAGQKGG